MGFEQWFKEAAGHHCAFTTFFISMTPVLELRASIPAGVSLGLDPMKALIISILGNMVPVPFIFLFMRRIFARMRTKVPAIERFVCKCESRAAAKTLVVTRRQFIKLMLLMAVPLPGTGVWTGAMIAAMTQMHIKKAMPAIFVGVVMAGVIVTVITGGISALF